ncbi:MAG: hypothetical protein IJ441_03040, partial [Spirochaetaceae bacterium]|nr:hypothetical protein [Spirochaetaceae bacterium]
RENLLTPEPDDYMAQTVDARSYSGEEIVELMLKRGSTLTKADAAAAVELYNTVCAELIADGCNLNTPLMNTSLSVTGCQPLLPPISSLLSTNPRFRLAGRAACGAGSCDGQSGSGSPESS